MKVRVKKYLGIFFWATGVALSIRLFLIEDYRIFSDSMAPTLTSGDLIFVTKPNYNIRLPFSSYELVRFRQPRRGEVVAFVLPDHGLETYIKRVIATEGDEVSIRDGLVQINGKVADYKDGPENSHLRYEALEPEKPYPIFWDAAQIPNYGPVQVPQGYFFVLGDNRIKSVDSRTWGPIPYSCLKGKLWLIWLSLSPEGGFRWDRTGLWVRS